ncbi:transposase [Janthinobacterium sp. PSPC3-1]|uniref:transposase n=1 Tax=Janthinobacterium sp. PSPC3-1 TaxID=2804653 RepID=UPI003CEEA54C
MDRHLRPNKFTDRALQLLLMVQRWLPNRSVVVADSSFAVLKLLAAARDTVCIVTRPRLNAALYDPAPARASDTKGRSQLKGALQPMFTQTLASATTLWHEAMLSQWYEEGDKTVEFATGTAIWYRATLPVVPLR